MSGSLGRPNLSESFPPLWAPLFFCRIKQNAVQILTDSFIIVDELRRRPCANPMLFAHRYAVLPNRCAPEAFFAHRNHTPGADRHNGAPANLTFVGCSKQRSPHASPSGELAKGSSGGDHRRREPPVLRLRITIIEIGRATVLRPDIGSDAGKMTHPHFKLKFRASG